MAAHVGQPVSSASLNAFGCLRVLKDASARAVPGRRCPARRRGRPCGRHQPHFGAPPTPTGT